MLEVSSRITLWFDVVNSSSLSPDQKELILRRLQNRIGKDGMLRVIFQQTRSQAANREVATKRFSELLHDTLKQVPKRKRTKVSRAAKLHRLEKKKERSIIKHERTRKFSSDD